MSEDATAATQEALAAATLDGPADAACAETEAAYGLLEFNEARRAGVKKSFEEALAGKARLDIKATHALLFSAEEKKEYGFDTFDEDLQATCEGCKDDMSVSDSRSRTAALWTARSPTARPADPRGPDGSMPPFAQWDDVVKFLDENL